MEKLDEHKHCKSIFKGGKITTTKEEYTQKWIALINQLEKSKNFAQRQ